MTDIPQERIEGHTAIRAALKSRCRRFDAILVSRSAKTDKLQDLLTLARSSGIPVKTVDEADLGAQAKSHGGIVALCGPKPLTTPDELVRILDGLRKPPFLTLLDGVDDARDLGMILRTAEAFGVHALLLRRRAWDFDATTVSRSSSGAYERMPIVLISQEMREIPPLRKRGFTLIGCMPNGRQTIHEVDLTSPLILAFGGEKRGLSNAVRSRCATTIRIPCVDNAAALTTTHAAAIAAAEVFRQRSTQH